MNRFYLKYSETWETIQDPEPNPNDDPYMQQGIQGKTVTFLELFYGDEKPEHFSPYYDVYESGLVPVPGEKVFLVVATYSTGDTFGSTEGERHVTDFCKTWQDAEEIRSSIMNGKYKGYKPWDGYFESLTGVDIEGMEITVDSSVLEAADVKEPKKQKGAGMFFKLGKKEYLHQILEAVIQYAKDAPEIFKDLEDAEPVEAERFAYTLMNGEGNLLNVSPGSGQSYVYDDGDFKDKGRVHTWTYKANAERWVKVYKHEGVKVKVVRLHLFSEED